MVFMANVEEKEKDDFVNDSTISLIERAEAAAKKIEEENKKRVELLRREEELEARKIVSGKSEAGFVPKPIDRNEEIKEDINKMFGKASPFNRK